MKVTETNLHVRIWYLPHFSVRNINKPGKVRLVFDAAVRTSGVSLNDQLDSGPDLLQSLPGVLTRFRQYVVAFKADIRDMFLRVGVRPEDRSAQRFVWRGVDRTTNPDTYEMTCLVFGAKSSPSSAIYVKNKNASSFSGTRKEASESIVKNSYMDDYLASKSTICEARSLIRDVIYINAQAKFDMHSWGSNDMRVLNSVPKDRAVAVENKKELCDQGGERVLGMYWDTHSDELRFNVNMNRIQANILNGAIKPTKRQVHCVIMSVFDPLGFLAPFTLKSKILMQEVWRYGIGWDDQLRDEEHTDWIAWLGKLRDIRDCRIPRCITPKSNQRASAQLHVFCDDSLKAYAAAAYLRFEMEKAQAHVMLVTAKSRIASLKPMSVPPLQLQAALLGSRLAKSVEGELDIRITRRIFWSDSMTIIRWIKSEPRTKQIFVAHRLGEIGELTEASEWHWVPSGQNPSDDATRWTDGASQSHERWVSGPQFLRNPEEMWPKEKPLSETNKKSIDELETRKDFVFTFTYRPLGFSLPLMILGWQGLLIIGRRVRNAFNKWRKKSSESISVESINVVEEY